MPVPRHWSQKRAYLQGKRGIEKPPFKLPEYIEATGITEMRDAYREKEAAVSDSWTAWLARFPPCRGMACSHRCRGGSAGPCRTAVGLSRCVSSDLPHSISRGCVSCG